MRIWDDVDRCYLECDAVSIGSSPVTHNDGWTQRYGSYLTAGALDKSKKHTDLPSAREMVGKTESLGLSFRSAPQQPIPRCACGRAIGRAQAAKRIRQCWKCRETKRLEKRHNTRPAA